MEQYAVDFGRTADRIQMNPTKSTTLLGLGGSRSKDRFVPLAERR